MKKTYAYVKYVAPKLNKRGSFDAGGAAVCLGLTLNATDKDRYHYRQAEIEYPDDLYRVCEVAGSRFLVSLDGGDAPVPLNDLLEAGTIRGRMFADVGKTVEFRTLNDLTGGKMLSAGEGSDRPPDFLPPERPLCPDCHGAKVVTAFVDHADRKRSGVRQMACSECQGEGTVSTEHLERRAAGEVLREDRQRRGLSLREEAARLGVSPPELSRREHGQLEREAA